MKEINCELCEKKIDSSIDGINVIEGDDETWQVCRSCYGIAIEYFKRKKYPYIAMKTKTKNR